MKISPYFYSLAAALSLTAPLAAPAAEVSGPQVGDPLPNFTIRGVLDDEAGKTMDLVKDAAGRPLVLFFVHERTRQSIALARQVLGDAANRKSNGLEAGLVFLTADVAATEGWMKTATLALPRGVPIGISPDGPSGPPAYNLNPKVIATVIIAKNNRVVANFALTEPSLTDDAPLINSAISKALK
ncbi:MAG TPA: hypothetical protein VGI40_14355 [Pirellulaceae bacterium]|jgi:hypothetical protein